MLISRDHKFLFVANTKTASTTIEAMLKHKSDVAITSTRYGKHLSYKKISKMFPDIENEDLFKFGIVRDPIDWVISWYNYRSRENLVKKNKADRYTGEIPFSVFVQGIFAEDKPAYSRIGHQHMSFTDRSGRMAMDHLIALENLDEQLPLLLKKLGVKPRKRGVITKNKSPKKITRSQISTEDEKLLADFFHKDLALWEKYRTISL